MLRIYRNHILIKFISMILLVAIQCSYANSAIVTPSILSKNGKKDSNQTSLLINKPKRRMPNIVLILTDDQGYGDIGKFNNPVVKTPNIDLLANEGISFNNFHVDPTCSPTRAALMTGKHSMRAGVWHTVMGRSILPTEELTLAEILSDVGYTTAIFGKWHLGDSYPFRPQNQGFQFSLIHGGGDVGQTGDYWGNVQFDDTYYRNGTASLRPESSIFDNLDVEGKIYKKRLLDKSIGGEFKVPLSKEDVSIQAWFGDSEGNKLKTKNQIYLI